MVGLLLGIGVTGFMGCGMIFILISKKIRNIENVKELKEVVPYGNTVQNGNAADSVDGQ